MSQPPFADLDYERERERRAALADAPAVPVQPAAEDQATVYKHLMEEAQAFHLACIKDAYEILGIDGSDGEYRYKHVALELRSRLAATPAAVQRATWEHQCPYSTAATTMLHTDQKECSLCGAVQQGRETLRRIGKLRAALWSIASNLDDDELRQAASDALEDDDAALAPAPQAPQPTDEKILHLWDVHVGVPSDKYPLHRLDKLAFARAVLAASLLPATPRPTAPRAWIDPAYTPGQPYGPTSPVTTYEVNWWTPLFAASQLPAQAPAVPQEFLDLLDHVDAWPGTADYHGLPRWISRLNELREKAHGIGSASTSEPCQISDVCAEVGCAVKARMSGASDAAQTDSKLLEQATQALKDVAAERHRQIEREGWTPEHDDEHDSGELAEAAACYAVGIHNAADLRYSTGLQVWSWAAEDFKSKDQRSNLVRAGALILAEIERLDRAALGKESGNV